MRDWAHFIYLLCFIAAIIFSGWLFGRAYLVDCVTIRGHSMEPSFHEGERVWVSKVAVSRKKVNAGDVFVFRDLSDDHFLCKRCIAAPGDSILYIRSHLDTTLYSYLLYAPAKGDSLSFDAISFPRYARAIVWETGAESGFRAGYRFRHDWFYFLGDNRDHSVDSRHFGLVPDACLFGRVMGNQQDIFKRHINNNH